MDFRTFLRAKLHLAWALIAHQEKILPCGLDVQQQGLFKRGFIWEVSALGVVIMIVPILRSVRVLTIIEL